jgi:cell division protein ZapA
MNNVSLTIGGRSYAVACAAGEEEHVHALGRMIADKVEQMGGTHNEPRQLLFAALLLADELHEARVRTPASSPAPPPASNPDQYADALEEIAARLENCASALEG